MPTSNPIKEALRIQRLLAKLNARENRALEKYRAKTTGVEQKFCAARHAAIEGANEDVLEILEKANPVSFSTDSPAE